jgi:hypothetical protein
MIRIIAVLTLGLFIGPNANAQVTCSRVGDTTFCNGASQQTQPSNAQVTCSQVGDTMFCNGVLQQARPSKPRVQLDPFGSYQSGYEAGVKRAREQNLAKLTDIYFAGNVDPEFRDKFLADVAKNGGDVIWFRNDMAIKDQQKKILADSSRNSGSATTPSNQAADTNRQAEAVESSGTDRKQAILVGRHTGRKEKLIFGSTPKVINWNCEYVAGGVKLVWRSNLGSCPDTIEVQ